MILVLIAFLVVIAWALWRSEPEPPSSYRESDPCDQPCAMNIAPVCDQNGTQYDNPCLFNVARCRDPSLVLSQCGTNENGQPSTAPPPDPCDQPCPMNIAPVCDQHGRKYDNRCLFRVARCRDPSLRRRKCRTNRRIPVSAGFRESDPCDRPCPMNLAIVCDQHGKRYANPCLFEVAKCRDPTLVRSRNTCGTNENGLPIIPASVGPPPGVAAQTGCEHFNCGNAPNETICDASGNVYSNRCALERMRCMYPSMDTTEVPCPK